MANATGPLLVPAHEELHEVGRDDYTKLSGLPVTHHFDAHGDAGLLSPGYQRVRRVLGLAGDRRLADGS